ncbi:MAG: alpha/beta hydrolase-fold protein [Chryseolinea sp.]
MSINRIVTNLLKSISLLLLLLHPLLLKAQLQESAGVDRITISSKILNEDRMIYIHYPNGKDKKSTTHYPVMYVLDADTHFDLCRQYCEYLSRWDVNVMPEMIVVGITNTDRARDLTPTNTTFNYFGKVESTTDSWLKTSGGNENFFRFIEDEVMPYVNTHYKTQPFNVLGGHSFGGITALNCLLTHPDLFNAYIAVSPSIWWDHQYILKLANQKFQKNGVLNKMLFCSDGNEGVSDESTFHTNLIKFDSLIRSKFIKGLRYEYVYYPTETHMTVPVNSYLEGLRFIFRDWALPPMKGNEVNGEIIEEHYKKISSLYGYTILPNERNILDWSAHLMKSNETIDNAISMLEILGKAYPSSTSIFISQGDAYLKKGEKQKAINSFQKAVSLDPNATDVNKKLKELQSQ